MSSKRIAFMATGDIAIPSFLALINDPRFNTVALITQPDKPVGRKQILTPPKVKTIAEESNIPVLQPPRVKAPEELQLIRDLNPDVIVVMAYGQILPKALLEIPKVAIINLHASLLPKHRGASCIQAAIEQGDTHSGMTVMHVTEGLDEGDIILNNPFSLPSDITGGQLHDRLAEDGPECLLLALEQLFNGTATRTPQDDALANYAPKLLRSHGELDWSQSADQLERQIRAYHPWPGTSTTYTDSKGRTKRLKIFPPATHISGTQSTPGKILKTDGGLTIGCGENGLHITELQPEGKRRMTAEEFLKSGQLKKGDTLGS
ncbi:methionyl-tRNA formyltransferase [Rubritalea tangerina]|uniref:Methionyl-tRNA formyltransferase n=1 Tax=Rubritalea tangerina TaxID=430798 RepID=A0ABW4Z8J0_9BACT